MFYEKRIIGIAASCALAVSAGLVGCSASDVAPTPTTSGDAAAPSLTPAAAAPKPAPASAIQLNAALPQARLHAQGEQIRRLYGVMATGKTAAAAAESFRLNSAAALRVDRDELTPAKINRPSTLGNVGPLTANANANGVGLMYDPATGKPKFRLYSYEQRRDGIPVYRAGLRTLVREDGDHPVVWANSDVRPMGSFRAQTGHKLGSVDANKALQALQAKNGASGEPSPSALSQLSTPTDTIFAGVEAQTASPRMAVQYTARASNGPGKWTFVADAETGDILHVESNVHFDVSGTVKAKLVTSAESMECGTLGTAPLAYANLSSAAGNAVADQAGAFTIKQTGSQAVTIVSDVTGKYFQVSDEGSSDSLSLSVTPPGPANFLHQDTQVPPQRVLAQLNAYKAANEIRDQLLGYVPEYPVIAGQTNFRINVNLSDPNCDLHGGAYYDDDNQPRTLNFCQHTEERANTAFRSIVHHEYGHHMVDSAGSGQAQYGEGMADTVAMLYAKDPKIGVGFYLNQCNNPLRNVVNTCQYSATNCSSCGAGSYECGALIGGTVWDIWKQLDITNPTTSGDIIRELVFSSIPLHTGTSIDASLAIDLLTLDDNDALLENGTPHYAEICAGFAAHGMTCPPIVNGLVVKGVDLVAEGPSKGPFAPASVSYTLHNLGPQQSLSYSVTTPSGSSWLSVDKTSGTIALGQQATVVVSINQAQAALLADGKYTAAVQFVNASSGVGTVSREEKLRVGAPVPIYTATFNAGLDGFTVDNFTDNLWHRTSACADGLPGHTAPGSLYYGKDSVCNYATPNPGLHTINSPDITIANPQTAELGFKYFLTTENSSEFDKATVSISVNGAAFQLAASNNSGGEKLKEGNAWQELRFDLAKLLPASGSTKIRLQFAFNTVDINGNSKMGFLVDDVTVYAQPASTSQGPCAGYCSNPLTFATNGYNNYQSGELGTSATCHQTTGLIRGGTCGNFVSTRKLFINGVAMTCNWQNWTSIPPAKNGGYCVYTTSGNERYAAFTTW